MPQELENNEGMQKSPLVSASGRILTVIILSLLIVIADQWIKIWVKTSFYMGEDLPLTSWWHLKFIENNGMAFGLELWNKYFLTFGRIIAVIAFVLFVVTVRAMKELRTGFFIAMALIIAGAAGNIFDCVFYGVIFNNPMPPEVAEIFPAGGGYAGCFEGRVVDMMYFPLFSFYFPDWLPWVGGQPFEFFQYIFNIADASICVGVALLIFFYSTDAGKALNFVMEKFSGKKNEKEK